MKKQILLQLMILFCNHYPYFVTVRTRVLNQKLEIGKVKNREPLKNLEKS